MTTKDHVSEGEALWIVSDAERAPGWKSCPEKAEERGAPLLPTHRCAALAGCNLVHYTAIQRITKYPVIRSFKHKGLERYFTKGDHRGIPAQSAARIDRMLDRLDASGAPGDMDLPGYRFHPLKGARVGEYAVSVSGNWRLTFRFNGEDAVDVNLEDYH